MEIFNMLDNKRKTT